MDRYSRETRAWLDLRFDPEALAACGHAYEPYQPVGGLRPGDWTPGTYLMASRWIRLAHLLRTLNAETFLDVGGAEGHTSWLMGAATGVATVSADLSLAAARRAREFFAGDTLASEAHRLPFADQAFDVVYLGEVIEHLANPLATLLELQRVARRAVVVTSEACVPNEEARRIELAERAYQEHMDRSILCPHDFPLLMPGWALTITNQCAEIPEPVPGEPYALAASLAHTLTRHDLDPPAHGLCVVAAREIPIPAPDNTVTLDIQAVMPRLEAAPRTRHPSGGPLPDTLAARLVCPHCRGPLSATHQLLSCARCAVDYPVVDGVPDLVDPRDEPSPDLPQLLRSRFADDEARITAALDLDRMLRFEQPAPLDERHLLAADAGRWHPGPGVRIEPLDGGGLLLHAEQDDPCLFSPRLDRPLADVRAVAVSLRARRARGDTETLQLFVKTLHRPLWWELGSTTADYLADGTVQRVRLPLPPLERFGPADELLALRLDPAHEPVEIELLGVELEG